MFFDIKKEAYKKSIELLIDNSNEFGLMAASPGEKSEKKMYTNIFSRDASISVLGMIASGEKKLEEISRNSLKTLAERQTNLGQIPSSVNPDYEEDYFYYLGSIDSTLWWLIALDFYDKHSSDKNLKKELSEKVKKAIDWLFYQDTNNDGLLEQGEASDWADYLPNNGIVLYTNVLWYRVLDVYGFSEEAGLAYDGINNIFLPHEADEKNSIYLQKEKYRVKTLNILKENTQSFPYYLHYISFRYASERCDVYANLLAILFGVSEKKRSEAILNIIEKERSGKRTPVQVLFPTINKRDENFREYLREEPSLNKSGSYHNGGVWPYVGGFWVTALDKTGQKSQARKELRRLAELNKKNNWGFNEWFEAKSGKPSGMTGQSWNAAMYIFAFNYLEGKIEL